MPPSGINLTLMNVNTVSPETPGCSSKYSVTAIGSVGLLSNNVPHELHTDAESTFLCLQLGQIFSATIGSRLHTSVYLFAHRIYPEILHLIAKNLKRLDGLRENNFPSQPQRSQRKVYNFC